MALVSNSGKRSAINRKRLAGLGFDPAWFRAIQTSGEVAHQTLRAMLDSNDLAPGAPVFLMSRGADTSPVAGLDLTPVTQPRAAQLLLIAGVDVQLGIEHYRTILGPMAAARIPAICMNPDLHSFGRDGITFGPGRLAHEYEAMGGRVEMIGKPHRTIFDAARAQLGDIAPENCVMIGDSPGHDIIGGHLAGMRTCLIASGVFAQDKDAAARCPVPDYWMETLS